MALISIDLAAKELDISVSSVRRLVMSGKLKYVRVGTLMKFNQADICQFINEATTTGLEYKSADDYTESAAVVLPMSRQRLSKLKLAKILSMKPSDRKATL